MKKLILLISFLFLSISSHAFHDGFGSYVDGGEFLSDSGIYGPSYDAQVEHLQELQKLFPQYATAVTYGESIGKRPLAGVIFRNPNMHSDKFTLITGATHGNEYLNIVDRLPLALMQKEDSNFMKYLNSGGTVVFIPILNPDGYEARRRQNNQYQDLNRDFPNPNISRDGFKQPETFYLAQLVANIAQDKQMQLAVDYHCCVRGMLLIPFGYTRKYMPDSHMAAYSPMMTAMDNSFENPGRKGTPPDLLYSAQGTSLDYWYMHYGAISMTYEGRYSVEKEMLENHVYWWEQMFEVLNN